MDKKQAHAALKKARETSKKRNFSQTFELIINLKDIDFKKPEGQLDFFVTLHHGTGKNKKVCALVGAELETEAGKYCDKVILQTDFGKYTKKAELKKIAKEYDYFIAQANIMAKVATAFGKVLGPKGKMPNPKAGCVVPPKANLEPLIKGLKNMVRINTKVSPMIQVPLGKEDMDDERILDNLMTVYDQIVHHLPGEENNIKTAYVKLTMGTAIKVE
ncbi:MAG: 50S ribosomal protein L1 [DPANN group archaeon]|nr:50S ribosomal protein L1 [DPANN group archaeon]